MPLLGRFAIPFDSFRVVKRHSVPLIVATTEVALGLRIPLFGGFAIPYGSFGRVSVHTITKIVVKAKPALCLHIPLLGGFAVPFDRFLIVLGRSEEHTSELQSLRHLVC